MRNFIGTVRSKVCLPLRRISLRSTLSARHVVLATGGSGQVFARTTNPQVATGDGVALAIAADVDVKDLEFYQFHPTCLAVPGTGVVDDSSVER